MTKSKKTILIGLLSMLFCSIIAFVGINFMPSKTYADSALLTLEDSASAKIVTDDGTGLTNSGLRFQAKLEKTAYNALLDEYENVEAGIIIVPEDYVTKAGGYTFDKLDALEILEGKTYYKITSSFKADATYYHFYNSIVTIKPANYNRSFTAVAFVKITESNEDKIANLTDYTLYEGAYYLYSNSHTANIYDIAYACYEDRVSEETEGYFEIDDGSGLYGKLDSSEYTVLERYLDGVAVLSAENGQVSIANNGGTYYKSPYSIGNSIEGYYFVNQAPTALTYNGERVKDLSVIDNANKVKIYSDLLTEGATFNADGTVTLEGRKNTTGLGIFAPTNYNNSYLAFEGDFGVGTYIDFTFIGNNLPQVTLFANEINGCMGCGNTADNYETDGAKYTGFLLVNGWYTKTSWTQATGDVYETRYGDRVLMFGPERISQNANYMMSVADLAISSTVPTLEQETLAADTSGTEYRYTVGSYEDGGIVYIEISITNLTTNVTETKSKSTGLSKAECEALGGNIIAFGCVKEDYQSGTTFSYSAPYQVEKTGVVSNGAKYNRDGSVTLIGKVPSSRGWTTIAKTENSYIAFDGNYGVGTYIDFTFTGNNLPQVTLFANEITAVMGNGNTETGATSGDYTGYILMNGLYWYAPNNIGTTNTVSEELQIEYLVCFGPNKINAGQNYYWDYANIFNPYIMSGSKDTLLTQKALKADTSGDEYKYTVGSYVSEGVVIIEANLFNVTDNVQIVTATYNTGKTETEIEEVGGKIIAYGCYKEGFRDGTTFTYTNPYTK